MYKLFPPNKINSWYGYRTRRSKASQANWELANHLAGNILLVGACLMTCTYIYVELILHKNVKDILLYMFGVILLSIFIIVEYRLRIK